MNEYIDGFIFASTIKWLGILLLLIAGIITIFKFRHWSSYIIFLSSLAIFICEILGIVWPVLESQKGPERIVEVQAYIANLKALAFILFSIGFLIFTTRLKKTTIKL